MITNATAIIVAGGKGIRMGEPLPKQYIKIGGKAIISHTIEKFELCPLIKDIIIVVSKDQHEYFLKEIKGSFKKIKAVAEGGAERQISVYNGLTCVDKNADIVLIHDGVRPFVKIEDIEKVIKTAEEHGNCTLGVLVKDTVKEVNHHNIVTKTLNRNNLFSIQTPQGFKYAHIMAAHNKALAESFFGTDDCTLVENIGIPTRIVEGSYDNIKITTKEDLVFAKMLMGGEII